MQLLTVILIGIIFQCHGDKIRIRRDTADIIAAKCDEYTKPLNKEFEILSLVANSKPQTYYKKVCEYNTESLIVGGKPAEKGEFPHMASVGYGTTNIGWNCAGTLISRRYVLSAAHCAYTRHGPATKIRMGVTHLHHDEDTRQDFDIVEIIRHPSYTREQKYNDIVLFKLDRDVVFTKRLRPACLWSASQLTATLATATGWGQTSYIGSTSDDLLKVSLSIFPNSQCEHTYEEERKKLPRGIDDTMMCAGHQEGGKDTCLGDSGGPLTITKSDNECIFYLVGITSFGKFCGGANTPAVYTRVSAYADWIADTIW